MSIAYDEAFFKDHEDGSYRSALRVVPRIIELVSPKSVVDIGCGNGTWLAAFLKHGVESVYGIDGPYVQADQLRIPADRFMPHDLEQPIPAERVPKADLALSLELAEHLTPQAGERLVATTVNIAEAVVFSAAAPMQGGTNHINEQWPDYWAQRFAAHGYVQVDTLRPTIWGDDEVMPWYRQNMLLYVKEGSTRHRGLLGLAPTVLSSVPVVHPGMLQRARNRDYQAVAIRKLVAELWRRLPLYLSGKRGGWND